MNELVFYNSDILLDIAPGPEVIAASSDELSVGILIAVIAIIALATALIVKAYRKNKLKQNPDRGNKP